MLLKNALYCLFPLLLAACGSSATEEIIGPVTAPVDLTVCTANNVAQYYMEGSTSSFVTGKTWMTSTLMASKRATSKLSRFDQPESATITTDIASLTSGSTAAGSTSTSSTPSVRVEVCRDAAYSDVFWQTTTSETTCQLSNLLPGETYYYRVVGEGKTLRHGTLTTTGQLRMLRADNSWNLRDLGGWEGLDGARVKYGLVYRGGSLDNITEAEGRELQRVGIQAELDLRGLVGEGGIWAGEDKAHSAARSSGTSTIAGAEYQHIMCDWGEEYPLLYSPIVRSAAYVIDCVRQQKPVYFHCKSGADRTGDVAMVLEGLLGLSDVDIAKDYELTAFSNEGSDFSGRVVTAQSYTWMFYHDLVDRMAGYDGVDLSDATFRERCYYYLNRYFPDREASATWQPGTGRRADGPTENDGFIGISADILDAFCDTMLGLPAGTSQAHRPAWAK